jgi:hypothetical protein
MLEHETVFHYTDAAGLVGIIQRMQIWCTHVSYLNDSMEFKLSERIYRDELLKIAFGHARLDAAGAYFPKESLSAWPRDAPRPELPPLYRRFAHVALHYIDRDRGDHEIDADGGWLNSTDAPFVASFSAKPDDLSQWRGYSGTGPRFAIEFRVSELQKLERLAGVSFARVSYDVMSEGARMHCDFLSRVAEMAPRWIGTSAGYTDPWQIHPPAMRELNQLTIGEARPLLKDPCFEAEAEYRLHSCHSSMAWPATYAGLNFRSGRSFLVPYVPVSLRELTSPIKSVTVGPSAHPVEARASLTRLLKSQYGELGSVNTCISRIPYRDW